MKRYMIDGSGHYLREDEDAALDAALECEAKTRTEERDA